MRDTSGACTGSASTRTGSRHSAAACSSRYAKDFAQRHNRQNSEMCLILHHDPWTFVGQSQSAHVHQRLAEIEFSEAGTSGIASGTQGGSPRFLMSSLLVVQPDPVQAELLRKALAGRIPAYVRLM